ncbi:MAG TPA: response regulator transcription factor [Ramlibacter sp.]|uniref:response regulator transcription factor n=1 Tax=Ramlibacter sp. TaxID=1917967 RepID=UPI002D7E7EA9|nr:response regulator transcription factor [Ramlibacter sp.]HET8748901.1 response regulator transcription factor [Ramlibacter sp.]
MTMPAPVRLLVVDDHTLFRRGLVALLAADPGVEVVGEAADGVEAVRRARALQPDLVLLDNHLPGATGIQAIAELREAAPLAKIVLLTVSEDEQDLQAALRAGANGYLLKTIEGDVLVHAIQRVMRGEPVISPELMTRLVAALQAHGGQALTLGAPEPTPHPDGAAQLSPREHEVLQEIARGASNKEIARTLQIAETTVKIHVQHILRKLGVSSRVQAAVLASGGQARP